MSKRVQHNRPTTVAMYGDCELTTGGSASNSRIVTAHLPQETQTKDETSTAKFQMCVSTSFQTHNYLYNVTCLESQFWQTGKTGSCGV